MVAEKKTMRSREVLVVIFFTLENQVWLKIEGRSRKGKKREVVDDKCTGVLD